MEASLIGRSKEAPNDARQVRSRNALIEALLVLLKENPFDQLTIREISARAGIGYATFFRHYPTKEALLGDIASDEISVLLGMTSNMFNSTERYASVLGLCNYVDQNRTLWTALLTGGAAGIVREEMLRQASEIKSTGRAPDWLPTDLATRYGTSSSIDLVAWWLEQEETYTPEQIATMLDRLIIGPLMEISIPQGGATAG